MSFDSKTTKELIRIINEGAKSRYLSVDGPPENAVKATTGDRSTPFKPFTASAKLEQVQIRPRLCRPKSLKSGVIYGTLSTNKRGLTYVAVGIGKVHVPYGFIERLIFQPCHRRDSRALIHFRLNESLIVAGKPSKDVQVLVEMDQGTGVTTSDYQNGGQQAHLNENKEEDQQYRVSVNKRFRTFYRHLESVLSSLKVEQTLDREFGFDGVLRNRHAAFFRPTTNCLLTQLDETWPPLIVQKDSVELIHMERVSRELRNFDMVVIFRDYSRPVQMITQIPTDKLKDIHGLFRQHFGGLCVTEGIQNLNWTKVLRTIQNDFGDFFEAGGWEFLLPDGDGDEDGDDETDEEDEDYQLTSSELSAEDESSSGEDEDKSGAVDDKEDSTDMSTSDEHSDDDQDEEGEEVAKKRRKRDKDDKN